MMVFIIAAEIYVFGAVVYLLLGSGKKQPWADGYNHDSSLPSNPPTSAEASKDSLLVKTDESKINLSTNIVNT